MAVGATVNSSVIGMMNDWYIHMRDQEFEQCEEIRKRIEPLVHKNGHDEKVIIYYSLLDFRHRLLLKDRNVSDVLSEIETNVNKMDNVLTFYFYFFKGMHAYDQKRYSVAIEFYKKAEEKLSDLPSDERVERAEFFYKVGAAYFHLDYLSIALQYAKTAHVIFAEVPFYEKRYADSMVLLGQIYADLSDFEKASENYQEALDIYQQLNQSKWVAVLHQNLGWFYSKLGQHHIAVDYYKLCLNGNVRPDHQLPTIFLMTKSYLRLAEVNEASKWLEEGIQLAEQHDIHEFVHKLKILKAENFSANDEGFEKAAIAGVDFFNENEMWDLVVEYAEKLADYYFQESRFKESAIYYKMVNEINNRNSIKGS